MVEDLQKLADSPEQHAATEKKTRGEKMFDGAVYAGLNGVGTFILTLPLAYWAAHGRGAKVFENAGAKFEKWGANKDIVKKALQTTALGIGGTVMIIPVRIAEYYRKPLVHSLNESFGNAQDKEAVTQKAPLQTWGSLLRGRALAWGAVFASFVGVDSLAKTLGNPQAREKFENGFSEFLVKDVLKKPTHTAAGVETKAFLYGKMAALDVFATTAASILLYTGSRFFARHRKAQPDIQKTASIATDLAHADQTTASAVEAPAMEAAPATTISGEKERPGIVREQTQMDTPQLA